MRRLKMNRKFTSCITTIWLTLRRSVDRPVILLSKLQGFRLQAEIINIGDLKPFLRRGLGRLLCLCAVLSLCCNIYAQRQTISLDNDWQTSLDSKTWKAVNVPHNWDDYYGYRRLLHGNLHGEATYKRNLSIRQAKTGKRFFLFFEGVGSYATVFLNNKKVGEHKGGRTTFTIDITDVLKTDGSNNQLLVKAAHPANIQDLPWVCGGCSDERGFSEGSQPLGIFRPVHLVITNDVRIEPFGVHAMADMDSASTKATLYIHTSFKNYTNKHRLVQVVQHLEDEKGKFITWKGNFHELNAGDSVTLMSDRIVVTNPKLWSVESPSLYTIKTFLLEKNKIIDSVVTPFGFRTVKWNKSSNQFILNGKPVFINGIAEYEHIIGQSHAFSKEQIEARIKWIQAAGFNAFRDGHQPHNLLYGKLCNEKGILWWTQLSAHVWYDTKEFRDNFKTLLREWVIERRNDPSVILWGLQNESKLPKDFAAECTALIRSLDPTASTQRLVTTCNGGEGTDWDVPQNWTGTYGGNPATYDEDLKKQVLVGEYGAWRTIDLHSEGGYQQSGPLSEDRMTALMEQKVRLAEKVKDSVAGHFFWLLTSHDNPGRVQGGEGLRELDRIGPVNYKGLLTPWEEPTDAFYMYRSNYADKYKEPMVYIVSHTWPNRWIQPGIKDGISVYSNCDEVELFNDLNGSSFGRKKKNGIGTHFQWDSVNVKYNVLSAVGYIDGKLAATDIIVLNHLPESPNFKDFRDRYATTLKPAKGYTYVYRINCGGPNYTDEYGNNWEADKNFVSSWTKDFPELPTDFASQRRTFSPIKATNDWKLFQTFRYGKDKLKYEFEVGNGEYLVELYFIEPWLGIGGGMKASGMRLFDVSINGKRVLDDVDIWNEAGTNTALKKTVRAKVINGKLIISFQDNKAGQAVISAIAIASTNPYGNEGKIVDTGRPIYEYAVKSWLDIGDKVYEHEPFVFHSLPANLYGADWIQFKTKKTQRLASYMAKKPVDFFIGISDDDTASNELSGIEKTHTQIVTDEDAGKTYQVYRKRLKAGESVKEIPPGTIAVIVPVNDMQPAYDLKAVKQYRTNIVKTGEGVIKDSVNGRFCAVIKSNSQTAVDYPVQTGVADRYSITVKYFYGKEQTVKGKLQLIGPGNTMMQEEEVNFSFTRPGKWNQFTINTSSQINAGNYIIRLVVEDAEGLAFSGIDIQ